MENQITHIHSLLQNVPDEDLPNGEELAKFWYAVAWELSQLLSYAKHALNPQLVFNDCRRAGSQYLFEFWVNDLAMPKRDAYNWHGHNVSQWQYAGAICLENGQVSTHH